MNVRDRISGLPGGLIQLVQTHDRSWNRAVELVHQPQHNDQRSCQVVANIHLMQIGPLG
jgi:hypothetical protein